MPARCVFLLAFSWWAGIAAAEPPVLSRYEFRETHMASEFKVVLYGPDEAVATAAARAAFDRIEELNRSFNDYDPESEISRVSEGAGGPAIKVSDDLFEILSCSRELAERTGGAFDVTIQPVVKLWRRARRMRALPTEEQIREALGRSGWRKMVLDPSGKTVRLEVEGMGLDLGGIAKGYACDAAMKVVRERGLSRALIAGAGDVVLGDPPPGEPGWVVEADPLEIPDKPGLGRLVLSNAAVSSSGDAERYVEIGGVRYSHIVDPRTGLGLTGRGGVTVVARNGTTSDSLATAVSVLGREQGLRLIEESPGTSCMIARLDEEGVTVFMSPGFEGLMKGASPGAEGGLSGGVGGPKP